MKRIIISATVLVIAVFTQSFRQTTSSVQNGKQVYEANCLSCHQEQGEGITGAFPALAKTGNLADKNKLVKIILQGMRGSISVKGVKYDGEMASVSLTDKETADVINYIRNNWGNKSAMISVTDVTAAKKAVVKGYQPY